MGFSLCPERGHEGGIREVPWEDSCSSMYCTLIITCCCLVTVNIHVMICICYYSALAIYPPHPCLYKIRFIALTGVYFSQVKNKPWHTWVYTWFQHCREQYCTGGNRENRGGIWVGKALEWNNWLCAWDQQGWGFATMYEEPPFQERGFVV